MRHRRAGAFGRTGVHAALDPSSGEPTSRMSLRFAKRETGEKRYDELQRFSPKPAVSRPARRGGRDAGAPVAQATGDAFPIVERPKWGGKYDDDGLRVSRYDFAYIVPKSNKSIRGRVQAEAALERRSSARHPRGLRAEPRE